GVKNRAGLQRVFASSLSSLNARFGDALASPFTITLGDEFQAVFRDPSPVWAVLSALQASLQENWQSNRFAVYHDYLAGVPVQQIAEALGISKTAVYKNLHDGLLHPIAGIHRSVARTIADTMGVTADA
ncbi:MAG: SatD family protein, partial [Chromatocurvus sp.]